jgi:hypothetical protein
MQDGEEANFCTEMLGITRNFQKRFRTGGRS